MGHRKGKLCWGEVGISNTILGVQKVTPRSESRPKINSCGLIGFLKLVCIIDAAGGIQDNRTHQPSKKDITPKFMTVLVRGRGKETTVNRLTLVFRKNEKAKTPQRSKSRRK